MDGGICDLCGKYSPKLETCRICGSRVCPAHMNATGLCEHCARGRRME